MGTGRRLRSGRVATATRVESPPEVTRMTRVLLIMPLAELFCNCFAGGVQFRFKPRPNRGFAIPGELHLLSYPVASEL